MRRQSSAYSVILGNELYYYGMYKLCEIVVRDPAPARPTRLERARNNMYMLKLATLLALMLPGSALMLTGAMHRPHVAALHLRGGKAKAMIGIVVDIEVEPDRVDEFLKVAEEDAVGSRSEPGCLRFEVLKASDTRFLFYETYKDSDAVAEHKAQPYFAKWTQFKESGGCKSVSTKAEYPGDWAFPQ
jgi:(4S)-4-hydroxy-5-phosphonooxypentane-2,3-dione isomerase